MTNNLPALREYCQDLASGDMIPRQFRGSPANVMYAVEYADALGIPRINAITSIHVIDGKPTASADLIASLVRKAGHKLRVEGDDTYAEVTIIRADDPDHIPNPVRWDETKARKAGKWGSKGPWTNYPGAMLRSRAITEAARMWASDALYGVIYTAEELGAETNAEGSPVHVSSERVQARQHRQAPRSAAEAVNNATADTPAGRTLSDDEIGGVFDKIASAEDEAALKRLWDHAMTLVDEQRGMIHQAINSEVEARKAAPEPNADPTVEEAATVVQETIDAELVEEPAA